MDDNSSPAKLRSLASWYRTYAQEAANPTIWEARLRTADDLEAEAARIENIPEKVEQG